MGNTDKAWNKYGDNDPYYGVLSDPRYRDAGRSGEARAHFFKSGEDHVNWLFDAIRSSLDSRFAPVAAVDFGCGVGRLVVPLAKRVRKVVGVDVSPAMLREAARNCGEQNVDNVTFVTTDKINLQLPETFDLIHSFIVFQHIPVSRGLGILGDLLRLLAVGGVGALHFTFARRASPFRLGIQWIRGRSSIANGVCNMLKGKSFSLQPMEMNSYPLNSIMRMLSEGNCHRIHFRFSDHNGFLGVMILFKKAPLPPL